MLKDVFQTTKMLLPLAAMVVIGLLFGADNQRPSSARAEQQPRPAETADIAVTSDGLSKVTLKVANMSCSGCITTIKSSLAPISGIQNIRVDLAGGKVEVMIDSRRIEDVDRIAAAITAGGYPAQVLAVADGAQIRKESRQAALLAETYVAAVGNRRIARRDFEVALGHARNRYASLYGENLFDTDRGRALLDRLKVQIVNDLIIEGIQLQEIDRAGYQVEARRVDEAFRGFLAERELSIDQFKAQLNQSGYTYPYFKKKFENRFIIRSYLEDRVLGEATNEIEKQRRYNDWFANAQLLAEVTYFDRDVKGLMETGTGGAAGCSDCTAAQ